MTGRARIPIRSLIPFHAAIVFKRKFPSSAMIKSPVPPGTKVGELVFSEICRKLCIVGYGKAEYFMTFTDAVRKHLFVKPIEDKTAGMTLSFSCRIATRLQTIFKSRSGVFIRIMAATSSTT
jgi:hypothetical protein